MKLPRIALTRLLWSAVGVVVLSAGIAAGPVLVRRERDWQSEAARRLVQQLLEEGR